MTIFSYGCTTCGVNGARIRTYQRKYPLAKIVNSKFSEPHRVKHVELLHKLGITDHYETVLLDGKGIRLLKDAV